MSVVFDHASVLTEGDAAAIVTKASELARVPGLAGPAPPSIPSTDRRVTQVILPVAGDDPSRATAAVRQLRTIAPAV